MDAMSAMCCWTARHFMLPPVHPPLRDVVLVREAGPPRVLLAGDRGLAAPSLRVERVELLLETLLAAGGLAGVDRAANGRGLGS